MSIFGKAAVTALAFAAVLGAADAAAQMPGGSGGGGSRGGMAARAPGGKPDAQGGVPILSVTSIVQSRLADLQEDLKLTAAQRPAWATYADRVLKLLADTTRFNEGALRGQASGPQRLDQLADAARNRATAVEDVADAGKALYALLAPEQQSIADNRLAIVLLPMVTIGSPSRDRQGDAGPPPR